MPRGRPRKPDDELVKPRKKNVRDPYNIRPFETRGLVKAGSEPNVVKNFWKDYSINQIEQMSDEEILEAIDQYLDKFIKRQLKVSMAWDFPINQKMLAIDPNWRR